MMSTFHCDSLPRFSSPHIGLHDLDEHNAHAAKIARINRRGRDSRNRREREKRSTEKCNWAYQLGTKQDRMWHRDPDKRRIKDHILDAQWLIKEEREELLRASPYRDALDDACEMASLYDSAEHHGWDEASAYEYVNRGSHYRFDQRYDSHPWDSDPFGFFFDDWDARDGEADEYDRDRFNDDDHHYDPGYNSTIHLAVLGSSFRRDWAGREFSLNNVPTPHHELAELWYDEWFPPSSDEEEEARKEEEVPRMPRFSSKHSGLEDLWPLMKRTKIRKSSRTERVVADEQQSAKVRTDRSFWKSRLGSHRERKRVRTKIVPPPAYVIHSTHVATGNLPSRT